MIARILCYIGRHHWHSTGRQEEIGPPFNCTRKRRCKLVAECCRCKRLRRLWTHGLAGISARLHAAEERTCG